LPWRGPESKIEGPKEQNSKFPTAAYLVLLAFRVGLTALQLRSWAITKKKYPPLRFFFTAQKSNFTSKTSINTNWIFKNFDFYLPQFCDIETGASPVYFSKNPKKMVNIFWMELEIGNGVRGKLETRGWKWKREGWKKNLFF
jgi:hypothetical protein